MPASNEIHWNQSGSEGQTEIHTTNLGIMAHFYTESLIGCKRRLSLRSTHEPCAPCKREKGNQTTIPLALAPPPPPPTNSLLSWRPVFFHLPLWGSLTCSNRLRESSHTYTRLLTPAPQNTEWLKAAQFRKQKGLRLTATSKLTAKVSDKHCCLAAEWDSPCTGKHEDQVTGRSQEHIKWTKKNKKKQIHCKLKAPLR